jgi:succinate dehydrogenase / fumarate reductase cytochrome b subunit
MKIMTETDLPGNRPAARPLSPHLTIYGWPITMAMSIANRVTGCALYFGTLLLAWWLIAVASGPNAYGVFQAAAGSWIGRLVLFGYTWALFHHMLGGVRHLIWDTIVGLEPGEREWLASATLFGSIALTIVTWVVTYMFTGGLRS